MVPTAFLMQTASIYAVLLVDGRPIRQESLFFFGVVVKLFDHRLVKKTEGGNKRLKLAMNMSCGKVLMKSGRLIGTIARYSTGKSTLPFAKHIDSREIVNPFPGLPALEAAIGRKITARIGSNECIPPSYDPLASVLPKDLLDLCRLYPDPYCRSMRALLATINHTKPEEVLVDAGADSLINLVIRELNALLFACLNVPVVFPQY
jgi:hypothetical protein